MLVKVYLCQNATLLESYAGAQMLYCEEAMAKRFIITSGSMPQWV